MVKIITTKPSPKPAKKRYEPETPWWKGMTNAERINYLAKLDKIDDRGSRVSKREEQYRS